MTASVDEENTMKVHDHSFQRAVSEIFTKAFQLTNLQTLIRKMLKTKILFCTVILIHTICAK